MADTKVKKEVSGVDTNSNEYLNELVPVFLHKDGNKNKDDLTVTLNGKNYQIQRGVTVHVPRKVKLVLDQSQEQEAIACNLIEDLVKGN